MEGADCGAGGGEEGAGGVACGVGGGEGEAERDGPGLEDAVVGEFAGRT